MSMDETEVPADIRDGERIEVIRLGGPRDGGRIGVFVVRISADSITLLPVDDENDGVTPT